jgi:hypothetical protein
MQDTVGGSQDGAAEVLKFALLQLPGTAEVASQIRVIRKLGIHEGRQHLTVRVDHHVGAFHLLEQVLQVKQVVASNKDAWLGLGAGLDFLHLGLAVTLDMGFIQHLHDAQILLATLQHQLKEARDIEVDVGDGGEERLFREGIHRFVDLAQAAGVVRVRGHALKPVEQGFLQALNIRILAADADGIAAKASLRLFTLIAEHVLPPIVVPAEGTMWAQKQVQSIELESRWSQM